MSPTPTVLGIAGRIGAGKTTAGRYLEQHHGCQYVRYSLVLADWLVQQPDRKDQLQTVGWDVMTGGLQTELNNRLITQIDRNRNCAVDGLRHPIDHDSLRNAFGAFFFLVYIDCPAAIRWKHVEHNGRYSTREEFLAADAHAVEQRIEELKPKAWAVLSNETSLEHLHSQIDHVLRRIRTGGQS